MSLRHHRRHAVFVHRRIVASDVLYRLNTQKNTVLADLADLQHD